MITPGLLGKARLHVRRFFSKHMPPRMRFHDLEHTLSVARSAVDIGRASGLGAGQLAQVELAALFHDTGYAQAVEGHEAASARLCGEWLAGQGVGAGTIKAITTLIMATRLGHVPRGLAQRVLRDADSAKAGQADFNEKSQRLKEEREAIYGKRIKSTDWARENLAYLGKHRFHTAYARKRYEKQKAINEASLRTSSNRPKTIPPSRKEPFMDRELSWLRFNARVLQEACDPTVPLLERLRFVAIHSSNLDEFYRVRVAQLRGLRKLGKWNRSALGVPPGKQIDLINQAALRQQQELGKVYRGTLLPLLHKHGIRLLRENQLSDRQKAFVRVFFDGRVAPLLRPMSLAGLPIPFVEDRQLYLAVSLVRKGHGKSRIELVHVPAAELGRFLVLPAVKGRTELIYLDDVVRTGISRIFKGWKVTACHAIKLSRDAELYLDEEFTEDVADKVRRSLRKRTTGIPARFLYDHAIARPVLELICSRLGVKKGDRLPGGRYHNLSDLMDLPIEGHASLREKPMPPLRHPALLHAGLLQAARRNDILFHFPYHDFGAIAEMIEQAARDPKVVRLAITLYRVASGSRICAALAEAARNGKKVDVVMEVQARFDEGNNLYWGEVLTKAGARVVYGLPGFKVHCKLLLVVRKLAGRIERSAYLGTGNFNEKTACLYGDLALVTAHHALVTEVAMVLDHLIKGVLPGKSHLLITSPDQLRGRLEQAIDREIEQALQGKKASILLKLNSLEDRPLIRKLYDADRAGVEVRLIIRGICCLVPGVPGYSTGIQGISIVDRFLEHARAYVFHNAGHSTVHLSSADWMERNMDRRVEVAFPVLDPALRAEVLRFLELEWADNVKARILDRKGHNRYRKARPGEQRTRSQPDWYRSLARAAGPGKA